MEVIHVKDLLLKYKKLLFRDEDRRRIICEIIKKVSGIKITPVELNIQKGELFITGSSVIKNELFLHKENILKELHKKELSDIIDIH